jgi:hypothetical protein
MLASFYRKLCRDNSLTEVKEDDMTIETRGVRKQESGGEKAGVRARLSTG